MAKQTKPTAPAPVDPDTLQAPAPGSGHDTPADPETGQPDTAELLRSIVKDRLRIRQLNTAKSRIDTAIKAIRVKIGENETTLYRQYEPAEPIQAEDTISQLELF